MENINELWIRWINDKENCGLIVVCYSGLIVGD